MACKNITIKEDKLFVLNTKNTTYAMAVMDCGYIEHLYYGKKIHIDTADGLKEQHAFGPGMTIAYDDNNKSFTLEDACLELSALGKGDIREPFIEATLPDGSSTLDFEFLTATTSNGKEEYETLPGSYDETGEVEQLSIVMKDRNSDLHLKLIYSVFAECDVITRSVTVTNRGSEPVKLRRIMSNQIDFDSANLTMTVFRGSWTREMKKFDIPLREARIVNASSIGSSSNRANPFVMISRPSTDEEKGGCYGFNLVYSGNHYESLEGNGYGKARFVQGINPQGFEYLLGAGDVFEAPEAVMTYAHDGFNALSQNMHVFVNNHIVRGKYKNKPRPVLLNSWEASYFDINNSNLLKLAGEAKKVGIELFVMDDGWFGERNDDTKSLGDWVVNKKKLRGGLKKLVDDVKALGLDFGIWVEPEMVNVNSDLYRAHPDWTIDIPGKAHSEGRNQRILDLCNKDVQDYIIEAMSNVFSTADISYVKWDMNRIFTDCYSRTLPADRQGEVFHRYMIGLYRVIKTLTDRFPNILFEGCSSGGNRFDLGILSYFPQIWASDNTDAMCRAEMQNNYSYGYPMSAVTAHVSSVPNHQTLRKTPIETRFNVAAFGVLGYECNLCDMKKEDKEAIALQVALYKKWRDTMQYGSFYRLRSYGSGSSDGSVLMDDETNIMSWNVVSPDKKESVGMVLQKMVHPNTQYLNFMAKGLDEDAIYNFSTRELNHNIKEFGDLVNTISPIHIKQDSFVHNTLAKFVKMDGEKESHRMYGDAIMNAGVKLKQGFSGTGFNEEVRYFQDFSSRLYFMEQ